LPCALWGTFLKCEDGLELSLSHDIFKIWHPLARFISPHILGLTLTPWPSYTLLQFKISCFMVVYLPKYSKFGISPNSGTMKKNLGHFWRSLHMVFPIGRSVKIYCIWSIFGIWRSIAYDQSLAYEDLLHMINLWHLKIYCIWSIFGIWRSIAYDQSLAFEDLLHMINLWLWRSLHMINLWHWRSIAYE
jgi:hypothetical protein